MKQPDATRLSDQSFPATWYRIKTYGKWIEPVTIYKTTPQFVYIKHYEHSKTLSRVGRGGHFPTWEEAHAALVANFEQKAGYAKDQMHRLNSAIGQIKSLRKPE